jgi:hypothetical protein
MKALLLALGATVALTFAANAGDTNIRPMFPGIRPVFPGASSSVANREIMVGKKVLPAPPQKGGCYRHTTEWQEVPCMSEEELARIPHPEAVNGLLKSPAPPAGKALFNAELNINMVQFGSEVDTKYGNNNFTLQLNTNWFGGSDNQTYWVQFTHEAGGGTNPAALCIWNINLETKDYGQTNGNTNCIPVDLTRGPQTGDVAVLQGFAIPPQSGGSIGLLTLVAVIPWPSGGTAAPDVFAMSTPDVYDLGGNWNYIQGGIIGLGFGSQAQFNLSCITTTLALQYLDSGAKVHLESYFLGSTS